MALCTRSVSGISLQRSTAGRVARPAIPAPLFKRSVAVRAETEETPSASTSTSVTTDETVQKVQAKATEVFQLVKSKWETTDNSEKPAAVAIVVGVVVAQIAIGATIDAVDKIPVVNKGLQLIGVAVTTLALYRYFTDPAERESVKKSFDGFIKSVTGDK